jgi:hypothetical protein
MRLQVRRVAVLAIALAVTLSVLFGVQHWLFLTQTQAPLQAQLDHLPSVRGVTLNLSQSSPNVVVTLGSVPDLESSYQAIEAKVHDLSPGAALTIKGASSSTFTTAEQVLSFPIEQGIATGQFVEMRKDVLQDAANLHMTTHVYVDSQNVYLALYRHGQAAYFVYPRGAK